jgi:hypothetical protein
MCLMSHDLLLHLMMLAMSVWEYKSCNVLLYRFVQSLFTSS